MSSQQHIILAIHSLTNLDKEMGDLLFQRYVQANCTIRVVKSQWGKSEPR